MAIIPFRWQGKARSEQVRALVAAQVQEWLRQWHVGSPALEVELLEDERPDAGRNGDRWYQVAGAKGVLSLRAGSHAMELLGCRLAGVASADSAGLAAGVGARALAALGTSLAKAAGSESFASLAQRPEGFALDRRCGVVGLSCLVDTVKLELFADAALCDAMLPPRTAATTALTPRAEAIGPSHVTLQAFLDLKTVSLADTGLLRPGEIIKTGIPLDAPITIRSASGETVLSGVLAGLDGRRALRCIRN